MHYLLWRDESKTPTALKVQAALDAYRRKHGIEPNQILVNIADAGVRCSDVLVCVGEAQYLPVQPNHFLVGRVE